MDVDDLLLLLAVTARSLRTFHETPIYIDLLSEHLSAIHSFLGCEGLLVGLVLNQCVTFEESSAAIEIQVNVFNVAELTEFFLNVVFVRLFMDRGDEENPTLDS